MTPSATRSNIRTAIAVITPQVTGFQYFALMKGAEIFRTGFLILRKVRLLRRPENLVLFAIGSVADAAIGQNRLVEQAARIVLGSVSIVRCSRNLLELKALFAKLFLHLRGKEYVLIKGDSFQGANSISRSYYAQKARLFAVWALARKIFSSLAELAWNLGDACVAYQENTVSEVFIHSKDLWKELTDDRSKLIQTLEEYKVTNDLMLERLGASTRTTLLVQGLLLPLKAKGLFTDIKNFAIRKVQQFQLNVEAQLDELLNDKENRNYYIGDMNKVRYIVAPKQSKVLC